MLIVHLYRRMALMKWKQRKGDQATGENLARAFESIGYKQYADNVRRICKETGGGGGGGSSATSASATNSSSDEPPKLSKLLKLLMPVSTHWRNIGVLLELEDSSLGAIETSNRGVPDNCLREMLNKWLSQTNPRPTKTALVEAVETYNPALAQKIAAL